MEMQALMKTKRIFRWFSLEIAKREESPLASWHPVLLNSGAVCCSKTTKRPHQEQSDLDRCKPGATLADKSRYWMLQYLAEHEVKLVVGENDMLTGCIVVT
jgi:hypothetical protein